MKNVKRLVAIIAVVLGVSASTFAQNGFSLRFGGSFPVGTFAEGGSMSNITLGNAAAAFGDAAMGWNAGLRGQFKLLGGINLFATADVFYSDVASDYVGAFAENGVDIKNNSLLPMCVNAPVMAGVNLKLIDLKVLSLWAEAGVGVNFHSVFLMDDWDSFDNVVVDELKYSDMYRTAASVAWQVGAGITIAKKVSLGVHYYTFGASEIEGTLFGEEGGALNDWANKLVGEFDSGEITPSMLVLRLGYHF